ncbi:MAG: DAK2 domain-containing protein, partial [Ruminococcus sp.]|nr:DAK2 domain-containing protein [Ruminococcus sp.]
MNTRTISGSELEQMIKNGLAQLQTRETEINRLNVFPVSDGDTGTNMRLTLAHGIGYARPEAHAGAYLKRLSEGMLLGARGNSGVILSQFFKGFYTSLAPCAQLDAAALCDALTSGYQAAYHAVVKPAEGTILTVTREGIEHIRPLLTPDTDVERLLALYIEEMDRSLLRTPEL